MWVRPGKRGSLVLLLASLALLGGAEAQQRQTTPKTSSQQIERPKEPSPLPEQQSKTPEIWPDELRAGPLGPEVRVQRWRIPTTDGSNTFMAATVMRPLTDEPRPLAVLNHGTPFAKDVPHLIEPLHRYPAEWFVERGFVVVMPLRRGHGITGGPKAEFTGCNNPDYVKAGEEASRDIQATIDFMYQQPFVKKGHIVVAGISTGGYSSLGFASLNHPDVKAVINFAGGRGGFVNRIPQKTCDAAKLIETAGKFGEKARIPTLWIYNENDNFFGPDLARAMHAAFVKGGGIAEFHMLAPFGNDGHVLYGHRDGIRIWSPIVDAFLRRHNAILPSP